MSHKYVKVRVPSGILGEEMMWVSRESETTGIVDNIPTVSEVTGQRDLIEFKPSPLGGYEFVRVLKRSPFGILRFVYDGNYMGSALEQKFSALGVPITGMSLTRERPSSILGVALPAEHFSKVCEALDLDDNVPTYDVIRDPEE